MSTAPLESSLLCITKSVSVIDVDGNIKLSRSIVQDLDGLSHHCSRCQFVKFKRMPDKRRLRASKSSKYQVCCPVKPVFILPATSPGYPMRPGRRTSQSSLAWPEPPRTPHDKWNGLQAYRKYLATHHRFPFTVWQLNGWRNHKCFHGSRPGPGIVQAMRTRSIQWTAPRRNDSRVFGIEDQPNAIWRKISQ